MNYKWLACLALTLGACPSVTVDDNEIQEQPTVEFDPSNKIIPFPNNLLLDPATGKVNLPEQCNESATSAATRAQLNKLDGFANYQTTLNVTFTEPVDLASLPNRVLLYQRVRAGTTLDPLVARPIPVVPVPSQTVRYTNQADIKACTDPVMVDQITFVPTVALEQKSTYTVALLDGIKTADGDTLTASFTWSLIRHPQPVVVFDAEGNVIENRTPLDPNDPADVVTLAGVDLLWKAHFNALSFLAGTGREPEEILLAWEFNTQTVTDPMDPAVAGSPASMKTTLPLLGNVAITALAANRGVLPWSQCAGGDSDTECFLKILLGAGNYAVGDATCAVAGCAAIDDVLSSVLLSKQFQADVPNTTYTGTGAQPIPGAWSDPLKPTVVHDTTNPNPTLNDYQAKLGALVIIPAGAVPSAGFPVVIFQHRIGGARGEMLGVAGGLASQGFAVIGIDAVNHGTRAVRISNATADGCGDVNTGIPGPRDDRGPDPTVLSDCYAPALSPDLAATRDSFRQTALDIQQLVTSLKACGTTACGKLKVNIANIFYLGHSLIGGNLGTLAIPFSDLQASVLNAPGAGWLDVIENTDATELFQCPLVDALIDAGFLMGAKYDENAMTGLCTTDAWKTMPGYRQFAGIGRWLLDTADPANFGSRMATKLTLIQKVIPDELVPNPTTDNFGSLSGQLRGDASCGTYTDLGGAGIEFLPSSAILATPTESMFLDYTTFAPGSPQCPPGNTYGHGSLLRPYPSVTGSACNPSTGASCDGAFATQRLQTDIAYFFLQNLE